MTAPKFKEGDRVLLPTNEDEGWTEQRGVVLEATDTYIMVLIDEEYREPDDVDGLSELDPDDAELEQLLKLDTDNQ